MVAKDARLGEDALPIVDGILLKAIVVTSLLVMLV